MPDIKRNACIDSNLQRHRAVSAATARLSCCQLQISEQVQTKLSLS